MMDNSIAENFAVARAVRAKVEADEAAGIDRSETRCALYRIIETVLTADGPVSGRWDTWAASHVQRCRENGWDDDTIRRLYEESKRNTIEEEDIDPGVAAASQAMIRAALERALARV
jgi:hypothetical protein